MKWERLGLRRGELVLERTLPVGQSFRWIRWSASSPASPRQLSQTPRSGEVDDDCVTWRGVVGRRAVEVRQCQDGDVAFRCGPLMKSGQVKVQKAETVGMKQNAFISKVKEEEHAGGDDNEVEQEAARRAVRDYFWLMDPRIPSLTSRYDSWSAADARFRSLAPFLTGTRLLRQDPLECLLSFICSSNNHISRITGMVNSLCKYGDRLITPWEGVEEEGEGGGDENGKLEGCWYAFPSVKQLSLATEEELRNSGFGYRAKFITATVSALAAKEGGAEAWLNELRDKASQEEAIEALQTLPGVGRKVASCVALFSLDKHACIPVDTHVWQLARKYYMPEMEEVKTLTPRVMREVEHVFEERFGEYAGWAHNVLFIAELPMMQPSLPPELRAIPSRKKTKRESAGKGEKGSSGKEGIISVVKGSKKAKRQIKLEGE